jgi:fumarate reductase flavoprotein subunit
MEKTKSQTDRPSGSLKADLVIIGGGTGGLPAAVAAAEAGCKSIIVIEKMGNTGGNAKLKGGHGGFFAVESPLQRRTQNVIATKDEFYHKALRWAHWDLEAAIVRAFINKSGDTVRWLESKGASFHLLPVFANQSPLVWHVSPDLGTDPGADYMHILEKNGEDLGVHFLKRSKAKKLITNNVGKITGVIAETNDEEFEIKAKCVIIATGGFGRNKTLLKKYFQHYHDTMHYFGVPNWGDGITMAAEVGAIVENTATMIVAPPDPIKPALMDIEAPGSGVKTVAVGTVMREPYMLRVNKKGKRFSGFVDYSDIAAPPDTFIGEGYATIRQPDGTAYAIFDDSIRQMMEEHGFILNRVVTRNELPGFKEQLQILANKEIIKKADSLEELAKWIGADPRTLKTTVEDYNTCCQQGYDPIFAQSRKYLLPLQRAPYYAIAYCGQFLDTIGGIKINENMEVLDTQHDPIPGLYAVGAATSGWESHIYCYVLSGEARGFAINSGRIAGENAAKFLAKQ